MQIQEVIRKKRDGEKVSHQELAFLIEGYLDGSVRDYHMAAWLMAVFFRGMTSEETTEWTRLMWKSGSQIPRAPKGSYWIDKHSTGGVGDKTSLIIVPWLLTAAEKLLGKHSVQIPMVSGRGLGHTGGTLDKLESVPGFSSSIGLELASQLIEREGVFMMGQTENLVPADKLLYALRDVTSTVDSEPLIVSSIMSKKLSESLDGIVFDVKTGTGALMKTQEKSASLATALVSVAKANGIEACALLTSMDQPLGFAVGNLLEVIECEDFILGTRREAGLYDLTLELVSRMLFLAGRKKHDLSVCRQGAVEVLADEQVHSRFCRMFTSQGGDFGRYLKLRKTLDKSVLVTEFRAPADAYVRACDPMRLALFVNALGGGRSAKEDVIDPLVGVDLTKKVGDFVEAGALLARVYHRSTTSAQEVATVMNEVFLFGEENAEESKWVLRVIE